MNDSLHSNPEAHGVHSWIPLLKHSQALNGVGLAQGIVQSLHLIQCSCPVGRCVVQHPLDGSGQQVAVFQQNLRTAGTQASSATSA